MISQEAIQKLATQYRTAEYPNIVREYFQHLFLSFLYKKDEAQNLLFKGGTALRIVYGSHRFSEDLDFSVFNIPEHEAEKRIEDLLAYVLVKINELGIKVDLEPKAGKTSGGYRGSAIFTIYDYPSITVSIEASSRNGRNVIGEVETIANDFIPNYNLYHLPQNLLVEEKIQALLERKNARDFCDIYFIMRNGLLRPEQKEQLIKVKDLILNTNINFKTELSIFLPRDQQSILADFKRALLDELHRQLSI